MEVIEQLVWGIASKPKAEILRKEKLSNIFKKKTYFFLISLCRSLDYHKETGIVCQLTKTATFIAAPMKKHI